MYDLQQSKRNDPEVQPCKRSPRVLRSPSPHGGNSAPIDRAFRQRFKEQEFKGGGAKVLNGLSVSGYRRKSGSPDDRAQLASVEIQRLTAPEMKPTAPRPSLDDARDVLDPHMVVRAASAADVDDARRAVPGDVQDRHRATPTRPLPEAVAEIGPRRQVPVHIRRLRRRARGEQFEHGQARVSCLSWCRSLKVEFRDRDAIPRPRQLDTPEQGDVNSHRILLIQDSCILTFSDNLIAG